MIDLFPLLELYNTYSHEDIYFDISQNILDHYNDLKLDSVSTLAESLHVSNSSVNRFIKQLYYENFTNFKMEHFKKDETYFFDFAYIEKKTSDQTTFHEHAALMLQEVDQIAKTVDGDRLDKLCERILKSESIIFVGIPLSSDIWWLQVDLILMGKKTSAFIDPNYQIEAIKNMTPGTLVIGIDIIRQDDNFLYQILEESKKNGAEVGCISHFKKTKNLTFVDEHVCFYGTNTRTDNYVMSLILNYIGSGLRKKNIGSIDDVSNK